MENHWLTAQIEFLDGSLYITAFVEEYTVSSLVHAIIHSNWTFECDHKSYHLQPDNP
jgi:hypothetical protein